MPCFETGSGALFDGDCVEVLQAMPDGSFDAVITDPPYAISYDGNDWDRYGPTAYQQFCTQWGGEALRVLKPGGHLLSFGATRTYHRLTSGLEDAGFDIRDSIHWLYGSGMPKGKNLTGQWAGWGTCLKPAHEPIVVARRPFDGSLTDNVATNGTGAINIDATRVPHEDAAKPDRWPPNVVLSPTDDGDCPVEELEAQHTGASRFYPTFNYCAKPSTVERNVGLDHLPRVAKVQPVTGRTSAPMANTHPTVKPLALMRWLVRLVNPPGGMVLDPFAGSGTTLVATMLEGGYAVGIEMTNDYLPFIEGRMAWASGDSELVTADPTAS